MSEPTIAELMAELRAFRAEYRAGQVRRGQGAETERLASLIESVHDVLGAKDFDTRETITKAGWEGRYYGRMRFQLEQICALDAPSAARRIGHAYRQASLIPNLGGLRVERAESRKGVSRWRIVELEPEGSEGS